ncbi:hypothetical protein DTO164E3_1050 [Paecilomyces variotii]|nr:hypothetical protein DTO032I3_3714 [Paecilomyces variotii]KAJ9205797.1 hypothetical protein DTO164E3_1050 [Paecilomyces variotii]KAJ9275265.1 hypothetical protein DTO021D3_7911 [Paecilomyces variotii]KAJ9339686.1 hypothetical protein DTO027B6_7813 [Paecilomyces variotii]KAJ9375406.1 hypothetical protein DTO032I4_9113 [Paecilomyces variotii]
MRRCFTSSLRPGIGWRRWIPLRNTIGQSGPGADPRNDQSEFVRKSLAQSLSTRRYFLLPWPATLWLLLNFCRSKGKRRLDYPTARNNRPVHSLHYLLLAP